MGQQKYLAMGIPLFHYENYLAMRESLAMENLTYGLPVYPEYHFFIKDHVLQGPDSAKTGFWAPKVNKNPKNKNYL